jgi:flagellar hook-length control protein FliK
MDISLSKTIFAANVGTASNPLKFVAASQTQESAEMPANINSGETGTTDNIQFIAQNKSIAEVSENFSRTLAKKMAAKASPDDQADENTKEQVQDSDTINLAESLMPQELLTLSVMPDIAIGVKVDTQLPQQIEIQASDNSVQLLTDSKTLQPPIVQVAEPIIPEPAQAASASPKLENEPVQPAIDQGQVKSETITPEISNNSPIEPESSQESAADTYAGKSEIIPDNRTLVSQTFTDDNKATNDSEKPVTISSQTAPLDTQTALSAENKATNGSEKPVTISSQTIPLETQTALSDKPVIISTSPSNQQSSKEAEPETLISDNKTTTSSEPAIVTSKSDTTDIPKVQLPNIQFADTDNQNQESPAKITEKTTPKNVDSDPRSHRGKTEFSDLLKDNKFHIETLSVKSVEQKMSQSQTQPSAPQAEKLNDLPLKQTSGPDMELGKQTPLVNSVQPVISEHLSASAPARAAGNAETAASVSSQIQESIYSSFRSGSQEIIIRLNPPELGKVAIKFTERDNVITGLLQVDKPQTRSQIQQSLPEIIQNLQDSGIQIKKIEVVLTNQQEQYTPKDQSSAAGQESWSGHQNSPNPEAQRNNNFYSEQLRYSDGFTELAEPRMQFIGSSINMLA